MAAAIAAAALLAWWSPSAAWAGAGSAKPDQRVTLTILPSGTELSDLARYPGISLGALSAGIGEVSAEETYTDISAGSRESPPSDAVPGLLGSTLERASLPASSFTTIDVPLGALGGLVRGLRDGDLLIALTAPPPGRNETLPIGIAGSGFGGNLTSDSTRTDGYVLSTDLAPTILSRLGVAIPDEMNGEPIRSEGDIDAAAIEDRTERMRAIPERRGPVVIGCLAAWIAIAVALALARAPMSRPAIAWLALAFAYMPATLLVGAALETEALVEGLLIAVGAGALAAATLALTRGWWALALACGLTVLAYAIDVIAGSDLTALSLLGPNPVYGVRFFGIGNELETLFAVMVPAAVGAALTGLAASGRDPSRAAAIGSFAIIAALATVVFAAGRFGADAGAAIVLPVGAAVAAVLVPEGTVRIHGRHATTDPHRPTAVALVIAAPLVGLAALAIIDLVSGGDAHLTRSVLEAGGAEDLAEVAERRLRLSADDFGDAAENPLFWFLVAGGAGAMTRWRQVDAWLRPAPIARAGFLGALVAVPVGALVNDSGATFLALGSLALAAFVAFAWAQASAEPLTSG